MGRSQRNIAKLDGAAQGAEGGGVILPKPDRPSQGTAAMYAKDATYPPLKPLRPPEGAPNVVIILIDDMGFGASSAFGGPIHMPTLERVAADGLKYTRFHTYRPLLAHAPGAADGAQPPLGGDGRHHRAGEQRAGLHQRAAQQRGDHRRGAAAERLQHRRLWQDAPDAGVGGEHLGPLRPLAHGRRL